MPENMEHILAPQVGVSLQYVLTKPPRLCYVSQDLCHMLGVTTDELLQGGGRYRDFVHPADRKAYSSFLESLTERGGKALLDYRLVRKDGSYLWVRDQSSVEAGGGGPTLASSVLTDITDLKEENKELRFLNDTVPCGFLKYTCSQPPQITYIDKTMLDMLRIPEAKTGGPDRLELYKKDIFLLVPMEEHQRFSRYLDRVYSSDGPIADEMSLLRCDGTRAQVFGWVTKCINEDGTEEFQSVCIDMMDRHQARTFKENQRYLRALTDIYDKIFQFDLDTHTLTCLHCEEASSFHSFLNVAMDIHSAAERWVLNSVAPQDQDLVRDFFRDFCGNKLYGPDAKAPQITYRARSTDGSSHQYIGTFIKVDDALGFYCCRRMADAEENLALRLENRHLRENMKALVTRFMDGFAAFEISAAGLVTPLYTSENVCQFFGYTEEEWLGLMERATPIDKFIANCEGGPERFQVLLGTGEAEFSYFDYKTETRRKIRAVCSQREADPGSPRYVMLYNMGADGSASKQASTGQQVFIRTFGFFDVFVGEQPIAFRNKKAKELLALLVDRRGGYISSEDAICYLWEDEAVDPVTLARYRKAALQLKNTLEEYGIGDIMENVEGKRRIIPERVQCDLYQYLSGAEGSAQLFKGSYLTNYSWGETTLGELSGNFE